MSHTLFPSNFSLFCLFQLFGNYLELWDHWLPLYLFQTGTGKRSTHQKAHFPLLSHFDNRKFADFWCNLSTNASYKFTLSHFQSSAISCSVPKIKYATSKLGEVGQLWSSKCDCEKWEGGAAGEPEGVPTVGKLSVPGGRVGRFSLYFARVSWIWLKECCPWTWMNYLLFLGVTITWVSWDFR